MLKMISNRVMIMEMIKVMLMRITLIMPRGNAAAPAAIHYEVIMK